MKTPAQWTNLVSHKNSCSKEVKEQNIKDLQSGHFILSRIRLILGVLQRCWDSFEKLTPKDMLLCWFFDREFMDKV